MIELNYIPENVELSGFIFKQTGFSEGIQSEGNVEGAAYAEGKDHNDNEVKVFYAIRPDLIQNSKMNGSAKIPIIGNGANAPVMALVEQAVPIADEENSYVAGWRSTLQPKKKDAKAMWGVGRVELDYGIHKLNPPQVIELINQLEDLKLQASRSDSPMDFEDQIESVERELIEARKVTARVVYALHHETVSDVEPTREAFTAVATEILEKYSYGGMSAGLLVRVRKGDIVSANLSADIRRTINFRSDELIKPLVPIEETLEQFFKYQGGKYILSQVQKNPEITLELIPQICVNCGPQGSAKYKKYPEFKKFQTTYFDHQNESKAIARVVACRIHENEEPDDDFEGNYLLSSAHSISGALGHFLELDNGYNRTYKINYHGVDYSKILTNKSKEHLAFGSSKKRLQELGQSLAL